MNVNKSVAGRLAAGFGRVDLVLVLRAQDSSLRQP